MRSISPVAILAVIFLALGTTQGSQPRMVDQILADPQAFAAEIEARVRAADAQKPAVLTNVEPELAPSAEWRFHPRYRGILIAIPVKRNLPAGDKYGGEAAIVDVVERLIRQRELTGRIEVVFIEPAAGGSIPSRPVCGCLPVMMPVVVPVTSDCGCR